jgi:hypothetical protein
MTQTKQGTRFSGEKTPNKTAFMDMGRFIRVYSTEEDSLLAALQLAQAKWGSVMINGTDEYKRRCAEIAATYGIRVCNPELRDIAQEFERENRPPMTPDAARRLIESEASSLKYRHHIAWRSYTEHTKALNDLISAEPPKPKLFGVQRWKSEHDKWTKERDDLAARIAADLETLGVKSYSIDAAKEAEERHGRYDKLARQEALRKNPEAAAVIREDDARIEREELARREAEEAKKREEKENNRRFYAAIRELAGKFNREVSFVTNAQDGRNYSGLMLGAVERNGHYYAAQIGYDGHVFLHDIEKDDLPAIAAWAGRKADIANNSEGRIGAIAEESERRGINRGWSR